MAYSSRATTALRLINTTRKSVLCSESFVALGPRETLSPFQTNDAPSTYVCTYRGIGSRILILRQCQLVRPSPSTGTMEPSSFEFTQLLLSSSRFFVLRAAAMYARVRTRSLVTTATHAHVLLISCVHEHARASKGNRSTTLNDSDDNLPTGSALTSPPFIYRREGEADARKRLRGLSVVVEDEQPGRTSSPGGKDSTLESGGVTCPRENEKRPIGDDARGDVCVYGTRHLPRYNRQ